jgi:hypothetical protein
VTRADAFSADFVDMDAPRVRCGTAELRLARTLPFSEVSNATDSRAGLQQLLTVFGDPPADFNLDVYEDASSGATLVIPAGARLRPERDRCRVSTLRGQVELVAQVTRIPANQDPNLVPTQFEMFAAKPPVAAWMPDLAWTYVTPFFRPDGLVVQRKAFMHFFPQNQFGLPTSYLFETLAVRGGTFLGVAAMRNNDLTFVLCMRGRMSGSQCPSGDYMTVWAQAALSVHLSTFSISAARQRGSTLWQQD